MSCCGDTIIQKAAHGAAGLVKAAGHVVGINGVPIKVMDQRINACRNCEYGSKNWFCHKCGCLIGAKIRVKSERCPIGKWDAVGDDNANIR